MSSIDRTVELATLQPDALHSRREWVKPTLERLALKDALANVDGTADDGLGGESS